VEKTAEKKRESRMKTRHITTFGWGAFFIWLGLALMFKAGTGLILLGVGGISLGMQAARKLSGMEWDGFWVLVAILFVVVGVWELFDVDLPLVPVFLVVVGFAFLVSAFQGRSKKQ
jgi:hypothetical protein